MNQIDTYLSSLNSEKAELIRALKGFIIKTHPQLTQKLSYGIPFIYGRKAICYFNAKDNGIDLGFVYGKFLTPNSALRSTNRKQVRSLFFSFDEDVNTELLLNVVGEAVKYDLQRKG